MYKPEGGHADIAEIWIKRGFKTALLVCLCDGAKGMVCAFIGLIAMPGDGFAGVAALACLIGQSFSVFRKFRGGGGGACFVGAALVINPFMALISLLILILMVYLSRMVSAGVLIYSVAFPFLCDKFPFWAFQQQEEILVSLVNYLLERISPFALSLAVILIYAGAIWRISNSDEPKIGRKKENRQ